MTYQRNLHHPSSPSSDPVQLQELKLEVEHLHSLKNQVPYDLRDTYFPANIRQFLLSSTTSQLQTYIHTYKPAILASIDNAKKQLDKTKTLHQFPDFTTQRTKTLRQRSSHRPEEPIPNILPTNTFIQTTLHHRASRDTPASSGATTNPYRNHDNSNTDLRHRHSRATSSISTTIPPAVPPTQRENQPRKHSKWKPNQNMTDRFKAYFQPSSTTPHSHLNF
jgi:hypothetical protein